jgi:AraC-like DNA-binding protein
MPQLESPDTESNAPLQSGQLCCPHPYEIGARLDGAVVRLLHPPSSLLGIVRAVIYRDVTQVKHMTAAQRLSQYSVAPAVALSWYTVGEGGLAREDPMNPTRGLWQPFGSRVLLSGLPMEPMTTWAPGAAAGYMVVFWPDALQRLFGLEQSGLFNEVRSAHDTLPEHWHALLDEALLARTPEMFMQILERHVAPKWYAIQTKHASDQRGALKNLSANWQSFTRHGRGWLEQMAARAARLSAGTSQRQIERRIKIASGRSMRHWQSLIRDEAAFFLARGKLQQGELVDFSDLAPEAGYADQAHLSRTVKRLTGFSPVEFSRRYQNDESFWLYRLWGL